MTELNDDVLPKDDQTSAPTRLSIRDLRRSELIEAAIHVIAERGFEQTTVRDVAKRAGASTGSVNYHFGNKNELLRSALWYSDRRFREELWRRLADEEGSVAKLRKLVALCLVDEEERTELLKVLVDFWQQAIRKKEFGELFDRENAAWIDELSEIFELGLANGELSFSGSVRDEAIGLSSMIDGLSLYAIVSNKIDIATARTIVNRKIDSMVASVG